MKRYFTVQCNDIQGFDDEVTSALNAGFTLWGSPYSADNQYCQAMYQEINPEKVKPVI